MENPVQFDSRAARNAAAAVDVTRSVIYLEVMERFQAAVNFELATSQDEDIAWLRNAAGASLEDFIGDILAKFRNAFLQPVYCDKADVEILTTIGGNIIANFWDAVPDDRKITLEEIVVKLNNSVRVSLSSVCNALQDNFSTDLVLHDLVEKFEDTEIDTADEIMAQIRRRFRIADDDHEFVILIMYAIQKTLFFDRDKLVKKSIRIRPRDTVAKLKHAFFSNQIDNHQTYIQE